MRPTQVLTLEKNQETTGTAGKIQDQRADESRDCPIAVTVFLFEKGIDGQEIFQRLEKKHDGRHKEVAVSAPTNRSLVLS